MITVDRPLTEDDVPCLSRLWRDAERSYDTPGTIPPVEVVTVEGSCT